MIHHSFDSCTPAVLCACRGMFISLSVLATSVALAALVCMRMCLPVCLPTHLSYEWKGGEEKRLQECHGRISISTRKDYSTAVTVRWWTPQHHLAGEESDRHEKDYGFRKHSGARLLPEI